MQFTSILFLAIQATGVLSASYAGNTGVAPDLSNSSMPPPGTAWARSSDKFNPLTARGCVSTAPFGCDLGKGRCWKVCGDGGQWCWTAGVQPAAVMWEELPQRCGVWMQLLDYSRKGVGGQDAWLVLGDYG
ncbi:hypothetical protein V499_08566 [Pseudogymnoascus sp. VKM F-103]|nr:hypothetical protein V499_08566 [Pseudogymnoascus sp. VKM F-103]